MRNAEVARALYEIADLLEMSNVAWKPNAFRKAARIIENLKDDIDEIYNKKGKDGLMEIPGVGEGISKNIIEFLETGKIKDLEKLEKKIPNGVVEMMRLQGLGPKKAWRLFKELKITDVDKLEKAAKLGRISRLEGFGEKSEKDILANIDRLKKNSQERKLLSEALEYANGIVEKLKKINGVKQVEIGGSLRRMRETIGDIDILVTSNNAGSVVNNFVKLKEIKSIIAKGETKVSVILENGMNCDLRIVDGDSYGSSLLYFTGNKEHNIEMRKIAMAKGWKLSEYGLFDKNDKRIAGKNEREIYEKLGLGYVEPEMREDKGELAIKKMPELIGYDDIKGDLHTHTLWSDGHYSTEEMIKAAINMRYEYLAITDHSKSTYIAKGLDEKRLMEHIKEIDKLAEKYASKIKVLKGAEVDILKDGKLDYSNEALSKLDVVIASVHSNFKMDRDEMTNRIIKAIENKHTTAIGHLTGRLINSRDAYEVDVEKIIKAAKDNGKMLEINASPHRLDIKDNYIREAVNHGVRMLVNTDSHYVDELHNMKYGIGQARRGWAGKKDIANSLPLQKFLKLLEK